MTDFSPMPEQSAPIFSLVLPTHNRPVLLAEAVQSIAAQAFSDWELILVDDASTEILDRDALERLAGKPIRLIRHEQPKGGAGAKRTGARAAKGRYLAFLDDDDLLAPSYLEEAHRVLERHANLSVLFMGVKWFGEKAAHGQKAQDDGMARILQMTQPDRSEGHLCLFDSDRLFKSLLERIPMPFQRPVVRRERYFEIGEYRPECLLWDCDWALRAVLHGQCALLNQGLYQQRAERQGYSSRATRALEQGRSKIEMKESLLGRPGLEAKYRGYLADTLSEDWISYAWQLQQAGEWKQANGALFRSMKYGLDSRQPKMLASGFLKRLLSRV